ncbi:hypothetical protein [Marinomonas posidonica]|uniref:hypothetical protein n=1 Tax=Marinomonas posidonica TaxID=936476 RepID=UPI003735A57C
MKKTALNLMLVGSVGLFSTVSHAEQVVNIYNWSDYMAPGALEGSLYQANWH